MRQAYAPADPPGLRPEGLGAEGSAQSRQGEEELCPWVCSRIREGRAVRQTILCNAIKWALAGPHAQWELVAFDAHIATERAAWRLKTFATTSQNAAV